MYLNKIDDDLQYSDEDLEILDRFNEIKALSYPYE